jgi:hypothetical protein
VIRNWDGADRVYPGRFQFDGVEEAVLKIRRWHGPNSYVETSQACRDYARSRFDNGPVLEKLKRLVLGGVDRMSLLPKRSAGSDLGYAVLGYLQPGTFNGYRIRIEQEIKQLRTVKDNLILIVLHQPVSNPELADHRAELATLGCRVRLVEVRDFFAVDLKEEAALPAIVAIERILAEYNVSVLHVEALYCMRLARMLAPRCTNLRIVFDNHGVSPEEEAMNGAPTNRVKAVERMEREALSAADLSIFVSDQMASHYEAKYDLPSYESQILPCCVAREFFDAMQMP